ncbi:cytochrome c biogenesis CcdA family protein [Halorubrum gandharaense]
MSAINAGGLLGPSGFAAGVGVAAFFSPCAYALLPGYVGYYVSATGDEQPSIAGVLTRGGAAVVGAVLTFAAIAGVAVAAGDRLQAGLPFLEAGVGIMLVILGVLTLTGFEIGSTVRLPQRRTGVVGFGAFGAMYALAAAGCVSPLVIAVAVQSFALPPVGTLAMFAALAGTFAALLISTTVLIALGYGAGVKRLAGYSRSLTWIAGVVLVVAGGVQIWLVI